MDKKIKLKQEAFMAARLTPVTPRYLLEGTIYALEQCGLLLGDAYALYRSRSYASAIVLAAFAREELGRSRILRDLRHRIIQNGERITIEDIRKKCEEHVVKQERAQLSTVQRWPDNQGLAKLIRSTMSQGPRSEISKRAREELDRITERQRKRIPIDRHEQRIRALYVEPNDEGIGWNRPREIAQDEARRFLEEARIDFGLEYDHFEGESMQFADPDLFRALQEWNGRPKLPLPPQLDFGQ